MIVVFEWLFQIFMSMSERDPINKFKKQQRQLQKQQDPYPPPPPKKKNKGHTCSTYKDQFIVIQLYPYLTSALLLLELITTMTTTRTLHNFNCSSYVTKLWDHGPKTKT